MNNKGLKLGQEIIDIMEDKEIQNPINDYSELQEAIDKNKYVGQMIENLTHGDTIRQSIMACGNKVESCARFSAKLAKTKRLRMILRRIQVSATIAAMLIASLLIYHDSTNKDTLPPTEEFLAVVKPVILLENGKRINLLSVEKDKESTEIFNVENLTLNYPSSDSVVDHNNASKNEFNTLLIPSQYTFCVVLSDKSTVYLNANSSLRYPVDFSSEQQREVTLEGEAYFKVAKSDKPFIVHTEGMSIKVYGTEFNVNTNKDGHIEALLVSGSVGVHHHLQEVTLHPNELYRMNKEDGTCQIKILKTDEMDELLAWRSNLFKFTNQRLPIILNELTKWYGVTFRIENNAIQNLLLNMSLERSMELSAILTIIETAADVKFKREEEDAYTVK